MIFIITHKDDFTVDFVIEKLNKKGIRYYRFNCEDIDSREYSFSLGNSTNYHINNIDKINSVWFRRTKLPEIETKNSAEKLFLLNEYDALLSNIYQILSPKKWLSKPIYVYEAENKLLQLKLASLIGLIFPDTLVTNDKTAVVDFFKKHKSKVIIKPLSQGRIIDNNQTKNIFTNLLSKEYIDNIDKYTLTPSILQPYIEKEYEIRVTIVNGKVFSAKVDSQKLENTKIDWRKEKISFSKYSLPQEISDKCLTLVEKLNLSFGAIDLIKTSNGEYVFLEINPNGQWAWIEFDTGLPISDEIINFLK